MNKANFKQTEIGMIPEDWEFDKLSNHLIIKGRIGWKGLKTGEYLKEGGYAIINGLAIKENKVDWSECDRITKERYDESPEIQLKENDILMTKDGTIGKIAFIDKLKEPTSVASGIFVIRNNSDELYSKYLFYCFKSDYFNWLVDSRIEGSVVPHLYQRDIVELKIPLPPLPEQQSIAKILSDLDLKIELNRKMNSTLEEIGKTLFKRWFIDFEFPNEKGEPYKSSGGEMVYNEELKKEIPKGWSVDKLGNKLKTILGGTPSTTNTNYWSGNIPWINSGKINEYRITTPTEYISKDGLDNSATKLVPKGTTLIAITGATLGQVSLNEIDLCFNQSVVGILESENLKKEYIYYWINYNIEQIINNKTGGAQQHINKQVVDFISLLIPNENILARYYLIMNNIFSKISINVRDNDELATARDLLLPKLMSGKIRVKD